MANSVLKAFTQHCLIIVVNRALMNIIKCCFLGVLTLLLRHCRQLIVAIRTELYGLTTQMLVFFSGGGIDYGPLPTACNPLFFSAGSGSQLCCNIPINDDNLVEGPETFSVALTTTDSSNTNLVAPTTAIVNIADNNSKSLIMSWK